MVQVLTLCFCGTLSLCPAQGQLLCSVNSLLHCMTADALPLKEELDAQLDSRSSDAS